MKAFNVLATHVSAEKRNEKTKTFRESAKSLVHRFLDVSAYPGPEPRGLASGKRGRKSGEMVDNSKDDEGKQ